MPTHITCPTIEACRRFCPAELTKPPCGLRQFSTQPASCVHDEPCLHGPYSRHANLWEPTLLGGWVVTDVDTIQSGSSLNFGLNVVNGACRQDRISGRPSASPRTSAEVGRGSIHLRRALRHLWSAYTEHPLSGYLGPGLINFDVVAYKDFDITHGQKIEFRNEFFNIFNYANFLGVDTVYGDAQFGVVTLTRDPRIVEFAYALPVLATIHLYSRQNWKD